MKDAKWIALFVFLGLAIAWFSSAPLRRAVRGSASPADSLSRLQPEAPAPAVYAEGTVETAPTFHSKAPALFLIARPVAGGMPLAVKRIPAPLFPVTFSLTLADSMAGGDYYPGDIQVIARLDADGSAGPKQPDDVETSIEIKAGAPRTVHLVLDGK
jgi:cytochrome c-type biogenesis protein CcmH